MVQVRDCFLKCVITADWASRKCFLGETCCFFSATEFTIDPFESECVPCLPQRSPSSPSLLTTSLGSSFWLKSIHPLLFSCRCSCSRRQHGGVVTENLHPPMQCREDDAVRAVHGRLRRLSDHQGESSRGSNRTGWAWRNNNLQETGLSSGTVNLINTVLIEEFKCCIYNSSQIRAKWDAAGALNMLMNK